MEHPHKVSQSEVVVCHRTLNLVKLCQVSRIQGLIAEHSVDGEVFDGMELLLLAQLIEHACSDCSRVSTEDVLLCLLQLPVILIAVGRE